MPEFQKMEALQEVGLFDAVLGSNKTYKLDIKGYLKKLTIELEAPSTITDNTGATLVTRNPGAIIPMLQIIGNRKDTIKAMSWNHFVDFMYVATKLPPETRETNANGATTVLSTIHIYFMNPFARRPVDTILDCLSQYKELHLGVQWGTYASGILKGAANADFTGGAVPTLRVMADVDSEAPPPRALFKQYETVLDGLAGTGNRVIEMTRREWNSFVLVTEDLHDDSGLSLQDVNLTNIEFETGGKKKTSPIGLALGRQLQTDFDVWRSHPDGVQMGIYPIPWQYMQGDGLDSYNIDTEDLKTAKFKMNQGTAFTNGQGQITVLEGINEPLRG